MAVARSTTASRRNAIELLEEAPRELRELPAWFATLGGGELQRVWVAAIMQTIALEDRVDPKQLAAAMAHVRDRVRVRCITGRSHTRAGFKQTSLYRAAIRAAPRPGMTIDTVTFWPIKDDRESGKLACRMSGEFDETRGHRNKVILVRKEKT